MPASSAVFLSYHSPDRTDSIAIQQVLQAHGISTFLDRDNLTLGLSWFEGLQEALGRAHAVIVLLGPGELGVWQKREIALALDRQANLERTAMQLPVIPVLLPKAQPEQAPAFLMLNNGLVLTKPIAEETQAMTRLVQALGALTADAPAPLTRPALCPYRGLDAFREEDAALFFGRDSFAENLLDRVLHHPVVAVVGASGSGKSSVVQAGLLPRLRRQGGTAPTWDALVCTPGTQPFHRLATALLPLLEPAASVTDRLVAAGRLGDYLATGGYLAAVIAQAVETQQVDRLLLVVDQFEELFTQTPGDQRAAFIATLLQATRDAKLRLVFTLRADFYGAVLGASRDLSECLEKAQVALGPARLAELRQMIEAPALKAGLAFEPGLVPRILDDLTSQPGNLPLLEYALKGLWLARRDTWLTHAGYEAIGGVAGAISQQAETIFESLRAAQQAAGWRLFSRLVRVAAANDESTDTRRRVPLDHLDAEAQQVAHRFAAPDVRLLVFAREQTTGDTTVEVAHEALIQTWTRLREWLQEERTFLLWRQDLERDVAEWHQLQSEQAVLYAGSKLEKAVQLTKGRTADLLPTEQAFLQQSQVHAGKTGRVLKWTVGVLLALGMALGSGWGWLHWTTKGQLALINYKLSDLATTTTSATVAYWSAARYLLAGDGDKALDSTSVQNTKQLWTRLLNDSIALRQGLLTAHRIELLHRQAAQEPEPLKRVELLEIVATAYGELTDKGAVADQGLQHLLAEAKHSAYYTYVLPHITTAYGKLIDKGAVADSSLQHLLAETRPFPKLHPFALESVAAAYGKLLNKETVAGNGLEQILAEAKPLLKIRSAEAYFSVLKAVVAAYGKLVQGEVANQGLQHILAEAKPLLASDPATYASTLSAVATAYGELASKGGLVDDGLKYVLLEAQPLLKARPSVYADILAAVASAYGNSVNKGALPSSSLQQELVAAKPLLKSTPVAYGSVLSAIATAYGELASKGAVADQGLRRIVVEAKLIPESDSSGYADILGSVAAAYGELASTGNGALADQGLRHLLAEVRPLGLATEFNLPYILVSSAVATAYGEMASAGNTALADQGLRHVLAEAQPFLRSNSDGYDNILSPIIASYGRLATSAALADQGLRHLLAEVRPLLASDPSQYTTILFSIAAEYGKLAGAGKETLANQGLRHVLAEARPLLRSNPDGYVKVLGSSIGSYSRCASTTALHSALQQISDDIEIIASKNYDIPEIRTSFAQLLAKHKQFARAYSAVDKMLPDDRSQALYLILERYYRPASKLSTFGAKRYYLPTPGRLRL